MLKGNPRRAYFFGPLFRSQASFFAIRLVGVSRGLGAFEGRIGPGFECMAGKRIRCKWPVAP